MKLGSRGLEKDKNIVLRNLFYRLADYIVEEKQTEYAFRISIFKEYDNCSRERIIKYIANEIPIMNVTYSLPKVNQIPFHKNDYTFKERLKILFKGRL